MPLGELATLKQQESLQEYLLQFQSLIARTKDQQPLQQMNLSTAGLVESLRRALELYFPGYLKVAMALAQAFNREKECPDAIQLHEEWPTWS